MLKANNALDFDDLLVLTAQLLREVPSVLETYRQRWHYLHVDEFQDTSDNQWLALENLIDEVMQDEERSFFYVGDVKQSIYGWRGGNHRLFHPVLAKYGGLGQRAIALESITRCYRSLPAVIDAVNAIFDNLADWEPKTEGTGPRPDAPSITTSPASRPATSPWMGSPLSSR